MLRGTVNPIAPITGNGVSFPSLEFNSSEAGVAEVLPGPSASPGPTR